MDSISDGCRLCLDPFAENFTTIDSPELKDQMIKVFYFSIQPRQGYSSAVCQSCSYSISEFYQYSEKVRQNQDLLNGNVTMCDPTVDSKITLVSVKIETLSDYVHPGTIEDACEPNGEVAGVEGSSFDSKITVDSFNVETISDSGLPETAYDACELKYNVSGEEEGPNSGDGESYESPVKKFQIKQKRRAGKRQLDDLEADKSTKTFRQTVTKTRKEKLDEEDQLFNQHFRMICDLCGTSLATFSELNSHFRKEHKRHDGYVVCCNKKLFKRYTIRDHINFHANPDLFRCEVCGNKYNSKITLNTHMSQKHPSEDHGPFKCDHCPQSFAQKSAHNQHLKLCDSVHPGTKKDDCEPKDEVSRVEEDSSLDSKITLDSVNVETISDSGLPETADDACEPKDDVSEEEEGPNSGYDELYESPLKKLQTKQKGHSRKWKLDDLGADKSMMTFQQTVTKTRKENLDEEDQLFNKHFRMICDLCGTSLATFSELNSHFRKEHKLYDGYVVCCNKKLFKRCTIRDHINFHANPDLFRCEVCGKKYNSKITLNTHMIYKHPIEDHGPFKCDHCPQSFSQKSALDQHLKRQVTRKCPKCNKMLACKDSLRRHMTTQHSGKDRKLVCDTCGQGFLSKQNFNQHINKHMGIKVQRVQCEICQRWLKSKNNLRIHKKWVHTDILEFQCDICLQKFPHSRALYLHKFRMHTDTNHECETCGKKFKKAISLKEHRATHTGEVLYACEYCGVPKKQQTHLYRHIKQHHPIEWGQKKMKVKSRVKAAQKSVPS